MLHIQPDPPIAPLLTPVLIALSLWLTRRRGPDPRWSALAFMYGRWRIDRVRTGGDWRDADGQCDIMALGDGRALTRRDRRVERDGGARARTLFDPVLKVASDAGQLKAEYAIDGETIRFDTATVTPGARAEFVAAPRPTGPVFRLTYARTDDGGLVSELALAAPGGRDFRPVLSEVMTRRG